MRRIGVLMLYEEQNAQAQSLLAAFQRSLADRGWVAGRNIMFEKRWAGTDPSRVDQGAKELVAIQPELIISSSSPTTIALLRVTRTIPIIFIQVIDPVGQGFAASMSHPGGNATGLANLEASMTGKWLELLKEVAPNLSRVAVPFNPPSAPYANIYFKFFSSTAPALGIQIIPAPVGNLVELESFTAAQAQQPGTAILPMPSGFVDSQMSEVAAIMVRHRIPNLYVSRAFADAGGLMTYGNDITDNYRQAATFVDRILKGEKASDLPVQLPVKFELVINLKTAKSLGLNIPQQLLATADELIE